MLKVYFKDSFGDFKNQIEFDVWQFPGGEQGIKLKDPYLVEKESSNQDCEFLITWEYEGDSEIFLLALLVDALKGAGAKSYQINLCTVYLPYARQDRRCHPGESFSLNVLANFLNSLNLREVWTFDVHSDVAKGRIENFKSISQDDIIDSAFFHEFDDADLLIAPDKGAFAKFKRSELCSSRPSIHLTKTRKDGKVEYEDLNPEGLEGYETALVIDDICDGGATFIALAEKVHKANPNIELQLYVTHGIFSKGLSELQKHYSQIMCFYLMNRELQGALGLTYQNVKGA